MATFEEAVSVPGMRGDRDVSAATQPQSLDEAIDAFVLVVACVDTDVAVSKSLT